MSRVFLVIVVLLSFALQAQEEGLKKEWSKINKSIDYESSLKKSRPSREEIYPNTLNNYTEDEYGIYTSSSKYSDDEYIDQGRNPNPGSGNTVIKENTKETPSSTDSETEYQSTEYAEQENDYSNDDNRVGAEGSGWTIFLVVICVLVFVFIIYYLFFRNAKTEHKIHKQVEVKEEWNPEKISKSELEIKLEEAKHDEDYRACVRIYYTFVLQALIKKGWVVWKLEKTNLHYQLEMLERPLGNEFANIVRLYELVWYGEYILNSENFKELEPKLASLHTKIVQYEG